jgi:hypothetical protein
VSLIEANEIGRRERQGLSPHAAGQQRIDRRHLYRRLGSQISLAPGLYDAMNAQRHAVLGKPL